MNFVKVLIAVGAYSEAVSNSRPFYMRETRDENNRVLYAIGEESSESVKSFSLTRSDLLQALCNAARSHGVEITTSSKAVAADPAGFLILEDGTRRRADLVVAADGVNSAIRDDLGLLRSRRQLREGSIRLLIPRTAQERVSEDGRKGIEYWSGKRRIYYTANNPNDVYLAFMLAHDDVAGRALPIKQDVWSRSFPHLSDLIARVGDRGRWDRFEQIALHRWSRGRVCVVGDAASAMTPNIGQGGGFAAMNALSLAVYVSQARTVEEGLDQWERSERPLTEYTQRVSYWYGEMNRLPSKLRAGFMRLCQQSPRLMGLRQRPARHAPVGYSEPRG
jgi:2-polyprenyl-6-methoxyphenol hydroxylase-like FAD-dependent oxidoreductase